MFRAYFVASKLLSSGPYGRHTMQMLCTDPEAHVSLWVSLLEPIYASFLPCKATLETVAAVPLDMKGLLGKHAKALAGQEGEEPKYSSQANVKCITAALAKRVTGKDQSVYQWDALACGHTCTVLTGLVDARPGFWHTLVAACPALIVGLCNRLDRQPVVDFMLTLLRGTKNEASVPFMAALLQGIVARLLNPCFGLPDSPYDDVLQGMYKVFSSTLPDEDNMLSLLLSGSGASQTSLLGLGIENDSIRSLIIDAITSKPQWSDLVVQGFLTELSELPRRTGNEGYMVPLLVHILDTAAMKEDSAEADTGGDSSAGDRAVASSSPYPMNHALFHSLKAVLPQLAQALDHCIAKAAQRRLPVHVMGLLDLASCLLRFPSAYAATALASHGIIQRAIALVFTPAGAASSIICSTVHELVEDALCATLPLRQLLLCGINSFTDGVWQQVTEPEAFLWRPILESLTDTVLKPPEHRFSVKEQIRLLHLRGVLALLLDIMVGLPKEVPKEEEDAFSWSAWGYPSSPPPWTKHRTLRSFLMRLATTIHASTLPPPPVTPATHTSNSHRSTSSFFQITAEDEEPLFAAPPAPPSPPPAPHALGRSRGSGSIDNPPSPSEGRGVEGSAESSRDSTNRSNEEGSGNKARRSSRGSGSSGSLSPEAAEGLGKSAVPSPARPDGPTVYRSGSPDRNIPVSNDWRQNRRLHSHFSHSPTTAGTALEEPHSPLSRSLSFDSDMKPVEHSHKGDQQPKGRGSFPAEAGDQGGSAFPLLRAVDGKVEGALGAVPGAQPPGSSEGASSVKGTSDAADAQGRPQPPSTLEGTWPPRDDDEDDDGSFIVEGDDDDGGAAAGGSSGGGVDLSRTFRGKSMTEDRETFNKKERPRARKRREPTPTPDGGSTLRGNALNISDPRWMTFIEGPLSIVRSVWRIDERGFPIIPPTVQSDSDSDEEMFHGIARRSGDDGDGDEDGKRREGDGEDEDEEDVAYIVNQLKDLGVALEDEVGQGSAPHHRSSKKADGPSRRASDSDDDLDFELGSDEMQQWERTKGLRASAGTPIPGHNPAKHEGTPIKSSASDSSNEPVANGDVASSGETKKRLGKKISSKSLLVEVPKNVRDRNAEDPPTPLPAKKSLSRRNEGNDDGDNDMNGQRSGKKAKSGSTIVRSISVPQTVEAKKPRKLGLEGKRGSGDKGRRQGQGQSHGLLSSASTGSVHRRSLSARERGGRSTPIPSLAQKQATVESIYGSSVKPRSRRGRGGGGGKGRLGSAGVSRSKQQTAAGRGKDRVQSADVVLGRSRSRGEGGRVTPLGAMYDDDEMELMDSIEAEEPWDAR